MRSIFQDLGWFVRRTDDVRALADFYREVVGLTQLASDPQFCVFWSGEASVFEILPGGQVTRPPSRDPTQQPIVPWLRCHGIDGTIDRLRRAGVSILGEQTDRIGRRVSFLDPAGLITGLFEVAANPDLPQTRAAQRRWDTGATSIPGVAMHAPDLQDLGLVTVHVADVAVEVEFYRDVIGLDVVADLGDRGAVLLGVGDTVLFEIAPGGSIECPARDRAAADNMWMIRVRDMPTLLDELRVAEVHFINQPFLAGAETVCYVADPEGHILGFNDAAGSDEYPVHAEANRRWRQR